MFGHLYILTENILTEVYVDDTVVNKHVMKAIRFSQYCKYLSISRFNEKVILSMFWTLVTMSNQSTFVGGSDCSCFRVSAFLLAANNIFNIDILNYIDILLTTCLSSSFHDLFFCDVLLYLLNRQSNINQFLTLHYFHHNIISLKNWHFMEIKCFMLSLNNCSIQV